MAHDVRNLPDLLNARLAALRVDQNEAAAQLGVSATTFSRWINGRDNPQPKRIEGLADWLGMTTNELLRVIYAHRVTEPDRVADALAALTAEIAELREKIERLEADDEDA